MGLDTPVVHSVNDDFYLLKKFSKKANAISNLPVEYDGNIKR